MTFAQQFMNWASKLNSNAAWFCFELLRQRQLWGKLRDDITEGVVVGAYHEGALDNSDRQAHFIKTNCRPLPDRSRFGGLNNKMWNGIRDFCRSTCYEPSKCNTNACKSADSEQRPQSAHVFDSPGS